MFEAGIFIMRLDLFLRASRIIIRRTLAQKFCEAGAITVNGTGSRSSKEVKPGDVIAITKGDVTTQYKIEKLPEAKQVAKADASSFYTIIGERTETE